MEKMYTTEFKQFVVLILTVGYHFKNKWRMVKIKDKSVCSIKLLPPPQKKCDLISDVSKQTIVMYLLKLQQCVLDV